MTLVLLAVMCECVVVSVYMVSVRVFLHVVVYAGCCVYVWYAGVCV